MYNPRQYQVIQLKVAAISHNITKPIDNISNTTNPGALQRISDIYKRNIFYRPYICKISMCHTYLDQVGVVDDNGSVDYGQSHLACDVANCYLI